MADAKADLTTEEKAEREAELERVGSIPAVYVDQWWTTIWAGGMRVTFGEEIAGKSFFRSAIMLDYSDVVALRDHLTARIARMEEKAKAKAAESIPGNKDG